MRELNLSNPPRDGTGIPPKNDDIVSTELPKINYQHTVSTLEKHEYINIEVKGRTLEECKEIFEQICISVKGGVESE